MQCKICSSDNLLEMIRYDQCPLSNRYMHQSDLKDAYTFQLQLVQCQECALIQLTKAPDPKELVPRFDWISYREPEAHLDTLCENIAKLPEINTRSVIAGMTYKDDTLLTRLSNKLQCTTWRIDPCIDLGTSTHYSGSEVILPLLTEDKAAEITKKRGLPDVLIARHIFEHAPDTQTLLKTLQKLVKPGGYVVLELPDCRRSLEALDYSMPWEEHILYFTPQTFQNAFCNTPFSLVNFSLHPYSIENVMMGILRFDHETQKKEPIEKAELTRAIHYKENFHGTKEKLHQFLFSKTNSGEKIAIFGAGHVSSMFINLMEIKAFILFVVDDDANKENLCMPGSALPVFYPKKLLEEGIKLCITGLSPEGTARVFEKQKLYCDTGGTFLRISFLFNASQNPLLQN